MNQSITESDFSYRGRSTLRADGSRKRLEILQATLRIISSEGVRGVRHRAVAKEAGASLSSTTYYFNDIHDLIFDAFTLFVEEALQITEQMELAGKHALELQSNNQIEEAIAFIIQAATEHAELQISDKYSRKIESAFYQAVLQDERLYPTMDLYQEKLLTPAIEFLRAFGNPNPETDAYIFVNLIQSLEYSATISPEKFGSETLKTIIHEGLGPLLRKGLS